MNHQPFGAYFGEKKGIYHVWSCEFLIFDPSCLGYSRFFCWSFQTKSNQKYKVLICHFILQAKSSHKHAGEHGRHSSRSKATASGSNHHFNYDPRSFLFVANELSVRDDDTFHKGDGWYNRIPPIEPKGFAGEIPGSVMRYQNGQVTNAPGYEWFRERFDGTAWPPGHVLRYNADGSNMFDDEGNLECAIMYKQLAVFSCNPLLPIAVFNGDPLSTASLARAPLLFFHPPTQPGISHAVHPDSPMEPGPAVCKYVAGASPSWMPSLVPKTYRNPFNPGPSYGLSGELPIILGLMAFSESTAGEGEAASRTFLGDGAHPGRWSDGHWHHTAAPQGCKLFSSIHILR